MINGKNNIERRRQSDSAQDNEKSSCDKNCEIAQGKVRKMKLLLSTILGLLAPGKSRSKLPPGPAGLATSLEGRICTRCSKVFFAFHSDNRLICYRCWREINGLTNDY